MIRIDEKVSLVCIYHSFALTDIKEQTVMTSDWWNANSTRNRINFEVKRQ